GHGGQPRARARRAPARLRAPGRGAPRDGGAPLARRGRRVALPAPPARGAPRGGVRRPHPRRHGARLLEPPRGRGAGIGHPPVVELTAECPGLWWAFPAWTPRP